ncbi:Menaquinone biosynthesis protein MenD [Corchorus olitorius]|uniref:Menaquinone biosynthesis protein MenD n=1 Tax=Corchorus olitorius TaxID=93759 RepID=A0A1R3HPF2_9ROSI|nr:Menaquinone biosynthesis protein MenD [Corchorus olitorius]
MNGVRFDGPIIDANELEHGDLVVETCITRSLPPALTLEHGLQSIKEAVEELKLNPPCSSSGILRFQVAVPPSAKALNWFCSQPESSAVFPLFFLSKEINSPSCKSLYLNTARGVFGIGAAVSFTNSSSVQRELSSIRRCLSDDSLVSTYGFLDINFNTESSSVEHEAGSFYFLIPLIELDEHEDISILAATLAWNDSCLHTFEQAIHSYEAALCQASSHFWPTTERCQSKCIRSAVRKLNVDEDKTVQMVYMNALSSGRKEFGAHPMQLRGASSFNQFCFKFSPTIGVACNMLASPSTSSIQDCANINAVWASLIVEECSRLGLTYFCVAPGSRSSPLALAASAHPLVTCISCFDERSLAFHAIGYARGSQKVAVIITTSGTAVSNLLPAVVEASQDFVPLLVLSADRPPELQDCGANQSINQVNHYGSFVRFFYSLPAATDEIPARMVLTTLDSAVHWATSSPIGPVHINCPFREPLDGSPKNWNSGCLKGLDSWMSNAEPFTKYILVQHSYSSDYDTHGQMAEIIEKIQRANKGLLLVGAIHAEDEIWAVLLLAKRLQWPVVVDILSGLRLRKLLSSFPEVEENILFVDYLDHALLSDSVRNWVQFDVIVQIGSRITSKRISQMLEKCSPCSYILVDNHPCRHDPSHFVTYRIQASAIEFANILLKAQFPHRSSKWHGYLQALNMMVGQEISFQICAQHSLSEPYIAHVISKALSSESALFVGNSMVIRDADMYGCNWPSDNLNVADIMLKTELPFKWISVAGNRGASGIDGLLSTAIGFAVGCKKRVLCLVGDISFLHDTNGLAILKQRMLRKPMTIVVINNRGGAIFSLLPIADRTEPRVLNQYFYTSHNISIHKLCEAHGVKHLEVKTKMELNEALLSSRLGETDCIIEVQSSIDANANFHSCLRKFASQAADHAFTILSKLSLPETTPQGCFQGKILSLSYSLYRIPLCAPPTSSSFNHDHTRLYREGFILSLTLEDGSIGYGEVAPLEICCENLLDVEEQLRFLCHVMKGAPIDYLLPMLRSSFSSWIWTNLGIPRAKEEENSEGLSSVRICALLDSGGTPEEVASIANALVEEGFTAIKIKVARRADPVEDAAVIKEVRKKVGFHIELRVDANRNWTYRQAIQFGCLVKDCNLQYIEEPVQDEDDIIRYCEESGLPVALDETIDNCPENPLDMLVKYSHPGIVAVVIKPTVIGGFEKALMIARWAHRQGNMAVISAAFESGLALSTYILFSCYLEMQNADTCKLMNDKLAPSVAHGLGTYRWLEEDVTTDLLGIGRNPRTGFIEGSVADSTRSARCISVDLPGHGVTSTKMKNSSDDKAAQSPTLSIEIVADLLHKLIECITPGKVTLVGYSMGARIALYMALKFSDKIEGAVILSGSPGLENAVARRIRRAKDDSKARSLVTHGLQLFLNNWYSGELWKSLRSHPNFNQIVAGRSLHDDVLGLARVLSDLSTGRQPSLWDDLKHCKTPLMVIVGEKDEKFKAVAEKMWDEIGHGGRDGENSVSKLHEMVVVPNCGHAVHLENPLTIIRLMSIARADAIDAVEKYVKILETRGVSMLPKSQETNDSPSPNASSSNNQDLSAAIFPGLTQAYKKLRSFAGSILRRNPSNHTINQNNEHPNSHVVDIPCNEPSSDVSAAANMNPKTCSHLFLRTHSFPTRLGFQCHVIDIQTLQRNQFMQIMEDREVLAASARKSILGKTTFGVTYQAATGLMIFYYQSLPSLPSSSSSAGHNGGNTSTVDHYAPLPLPIRIIGIVTVIGFSASLIGILLHKQHPILAAIAEKLGSASAALGFFVTMSVLLPGISQLIGWSAASVSFVAFVYAVLKMK